MWASAWRRISLRSCTGTEYPRDYIDVAAALRRYDRNALLRLAFHGDPGLRVLDVAHCMQLLDRLPDAPFAPTTA
jgi:hypothetical protein